MGTGLETGKQMARVSVELRTRTGVGGGGEQRGREGAGREGRAGGEGQREVKGQIRGTYPAGNGEPWRVLQQSEGGACVLEQRVLVSSVRTFWRVC